MKKAMHDLKDTAKGLLDKAREAARDDEKLSDLEEAAKKLLKELSEAIPVIKFRGSGLEKTAKRLANKALAEARDEENQREALGVAGAAAAPVGVLAAVTAIAGSGLSGGAAMTAGLGVVGLSVAGVALPAAGLTVVGYYGGKHAARKLQKARKQGGGPGAKSQEKRMGWLAAAGTFGAGLAWFSRKARLRRAANSGLRLSKRDRQAIYAEQGGKCAGCGRELDDDLLQEDHIHPKAHGGSHDPENRQLLCGTCNATKGVGTMEQLRERNRKKGIGQH